MADFRALCEELAEAYAWCVDNYMTGNSRDDSLVQRARAALAEEAVGPSDEELYKLAYEHSTSTGHGERLDEVGFARAVLARYGSAPRPVPAQENADD